MSQPRNIPMTDKVMEGQDDQVQGNRGRRFCYLEKAQHVPRRQAMGKWEVPYLVVRRNRPGSYYPQDEEGRELPHT